MLFSVPILVGQCLIEITYYISSINPLLQHIYSKYFVCTCKITKWQRGDFVPETDVVLRHLPIFHKNTNNFLCTAYLHVSSWQFTMHAVLETTILHRRAKQISRSGKYQTVHVLLALAITLSQKIGPGVVFGGQII